LKQDVQGNPFSVVLTRRTNMAKGQQRKNKEVKKPKKEIPPVK
jgi:hypothetical protein